MWLCSTPSMVSKDDKLASFQIKSSLGILRQYLKPLEAYLNIFFLALFLYFRVRIMPYSYPSRQYSTLLRKKNIMSNDWKSSSHATIPSTLDLNLDASTTIFNAPVKKDKRHCWYWLHLVLLILVSFGRHFVKHH